MSKEQNSYRQVMRATSLFGGVQVFNILISLVRSKVIAILIGPTGMGIASLLVSTMGLVNGITNLGLERSAVKDISLSNKNEEIEKVSRTIQVLKRLVWYTATFGAFVMIVTSPWLSEFAFGNRDFTLSFIWISLALFLKQLADSRLAILQGMRKLKDLAKANLLGNFIGLLITVPLYYYFRIDAIVPAIIVATLMSFLFTFHYSRKIELIPGRLSNKEAVSEGKSMIQLGFMLSLSSMITLFVAYIIQIYISKQGGIDEVGLYNAGFVILNSYVGIIFSAMATDYFPRLAAVSEEIEKIRSSVFEQALIAVLLIAPIIVLFLMFAPFIIRLLFSKEFLPIVSMVSWGILGMLFKAVSWSIGYVIIAKGDSNLFIKTAIGFNSILLLFNVLGYYYGGLEGLGISFFIYYMIHYSALRIITYYRYKFYFKKGFYSIFTLCTIFCVSAFLLTYVPEPVLRYITMGIIAIVSLAFSYYHLDRKLDIKDFIGSLFKRKEQ